MSVLKGTIFAIFIVSSFIANIYWLVWSIGEMNQITQQLEKSKATAYLNNATYQCMEQGSVKMTTDAIYNGSLVKIYLLMSPSDGESFLNFYCGNDTTLVYLNIKSGPPYEATEYPDNNWYFISLVFAGVTIGFFVLMAIIVGVVICSKYRQRRRYEYEILN